MTRVLISGGGIAGTATAIALSGVGIEAVVHEAYPAGGDDAGAFLTIMRNGMAALRAIGADRAVVAASYPAASVELFSADGERLEHRAIAEAGGVGPRTLTRAALYRALHAEARARGVRIEHGRRLVGAEARPGGGVVARFADGSLAEGDLLVGADGLHSVTRRLIDPAAPRPRYTGQHVVYGYADAVPAPTAPDAYHMVFGSRGFFGYTTPPDGRTWWFARVPGEELAPRRRTATTAEYWRRYVLAAFRDDRAPAAAVVEATGDDVVGGNSYDIPTTPIWHNGAMVVVGDAAHAASPAAAQGASMALEDAVTLARCLREELPNVPRGLAAFESLRRGPAEGTVAASARLGADATRRSAVRRPGPPGEPAAPPERPPR
ncbi:MAG TPA: NAD(P)/FAD-dependent oxidoreductase [Pilimelia sp.]|nr:NAD(P)/FAD-dependent oxidoreductase [Pilimelia sp.]